MEEELTYRTIAYLIAHYKNNDETMINKEEIEAINLLMEENQQLKEKLQASEKAREEATSWLNEYKKQWVLNDEVLEDMDKLLNILDIDKGK